MEVVKIKIKIDPTSRGKKSSCFVCRVNTLFSSTLAICNKMEVNSQSSSPSPSLLSDDDPQCNLVVDGIDNLKLGDDANDSTTGLQLISDDVLLNILLYCGPTDVEENLKFVNRRFQ